MKHFYVVDSQSGQIIRNGATSMPNKIVCNENEQIIIMDANTNNEIFGAYTHKYDFDLQKFVILDTSEQNSLNAIKKQSLGLKPHVLGTETEQELDQKITDFYYGNISPTLWKTENYVWLRSCFLPSIENFIEAYVEERINGDSTKMNTYLQNYQDVLSRFPEPSGNFGKEQ